MVLKNVQFVRSRIHWTTASSICSCFFGLLLFSHDRSTLPHNGKTSHVIRLTKPRTKPRTLRHVARDEIYQAPSPLFYTVREKLGSGAWERGYAGRQTARLTIKLLFNYIQCYIQSTILLSYSSNQYCYCTRHSVHTCTYYLHCGGLI